MDIGFIKVGYSSTGPGFGSAGDSSVPNVGGCGSTGTSPRPTGVRVIGLEELVWCGMELCRFTEASIEFIGTGPGSSGPPSIGAGLLDLLEPVQGAVRWWSPLVEQGGTQNNSSLVDQEKVCLFQS